MNLIDSHAHLFLDEYHEDLPLVIERARQAGVSHIFMPNIDSSTIDPLLQTCRTYAGYCFPMIGLHPTSVDGSNYERELAVVREELQSKDCYVAIGEIGLDLYWDQTFLQEQLIVFRRQLEWAIEFNLPVAIHCREAFGHIYKVLEDYRNEHLRGVFHCFTGTREEAASILEFPGFYLGINGVVTFKKSELPQVLPSVPLQRVMLETDAPYLAPVPHRGKRNESAYVRETLQKVADVYGESIERVAQITSENALKLFGISK